MPGGEGTGAEPDPSRLDELGDEELVERFLSCSASDRRVAHQCFEAIMTRYQRLINHIVRSSRFKFPPWDSAEDVMSRVGFKVYRGLSQWRRQGKLSSFIARITTSEMIDTIRRVGRDKSWDLNAADDADSDQPTAVDLARASGPTPETQAAVEEQRLIVKRLLGDVCNDWKDSVIVNEYIINSLGAKEISDKYGMSEDVIYQRARRLRWRLVKWLARHGITSADQLATSGPGPRA